MSFIYVSISNFTHNFQIEMIYRILYWHILFHRSYYPTVFLCHVKMQYPVDHMHLKMFFINRVYVLNYTKSDHYQVNMMARKMPPDDYKSET